MRLVRFLVKDQVFSGRVEDDRVIPLEGSAPSASYSLEDIRLLPPVDPTKIVAIGLNYRDHAEEVGMPIPDLPLLFLKPPSSVIGPGDAIRLPQGVGRVDYEAELAIIIGKKATGVSREQAPGYILGYSCLNDVTARELQGRDGQWTRCKGFDTFCPLGPWVETEVDPSDLTVEAYLNDERMQSSRTSKLVFGPGELVEFISRIMTLEPGDVIATGTPPGIGGMKSGDRIEVRIEGIGSLANRVEEA